jgi:hypothetical protein
MFEFYGWACVEPPDDDDLFARLKDQIGTVSEWSRPGVHLQSTINGFQALTVAGLRNHRDRTIFALFEWLAANGTESYGFLFTRDDEDDRDYDFNSEFRIFRLSRGSLVELDQLLAVPPRWDLPQGGPDDSPAGDAKRPRE